MTLWHIGNTTVRSPYRLKDALTALENSQFHGNLTTRDQEDGFARLLNETGVVNSERLNRGEPGGQGEPGAPGQAGDLGRKWRSAMAQLGFVVKHFDKDQKIMSPMLDLDVPGYPALKGKPYEITPNGHRLIRSQSVAEMQEVFLRSLLAYRIPSLVEPRYKCTPFSPLRFVLEIVWELNTRLNEGPVPDTEATESKKGTGQLNGAGIAVEKKGTGQLKDAGITVEEMALIVQQRTRDDGVDNVVSELLAYRKRRSAAPFKKRFDSEIFLEAAGGKDVTVRTWKDYADLSFRYLKATGLFQSKGRGIMMLPGKETLIRLLIAEGDGDYFDIAYIESLWKGARLPTDDKIKASEILLDLYRQLKALDEPVEEPRVDSLTLDQLSSLRYRWEERLVQLKEIRYAAAQSDQWQDIIAILNTYVKSGSSRSVTLCGGDDFTVPSGEAPAYFEWIIWRSFLARGALVKPPWESRHFNVDQDFLPLSHAASGKADLLFEFDEYVLVVEVTLMGSSRQEAAEGEPVRRHVARLTEEYEDSGKRVYCLFIAPKIDSNTADTFKAGNWYKPDDTRLPLHIVPVQLQDFIQFLKHGFAAAANPPDPGDLMKLLIICRSLSNCDAPQWKEEIHREFQRAASAPL